MDKLIELQEKLKANGIESNIKFTFAGKYVFSFFRLDHQGYRTVVEIDETNDIEKIIDSSRQALEEVFLIKV